MTIRDAIALAIRTDDSHLAGAVADRLRLRYGMNYRETVAFVLDVGRKDGATAERWEALMYRADMGY
jgi:hypothetical protein